MSGYDSADFFTDETLLEDPYPAVRTASVITG